MNLRYYLRGLGVGILVTAVIMEVASGGKKETLSDAEIKRRAAELGMVEESTRLSDLEAEEVAPSEEPTALPTQEPSKEPTALPTQEPSEEPTALPTQEPSKEPTALPTQEPSKEPTALPTQKPSEEPSAAQTGEAAQTSADTLSIKVEAGDGSYAVCEKLEQAGLIASAVDFDRYLYENGYDRKLRTGSYEIPADAEPETIAEILISGQ